MPNWIINRVTSPDMGKLQKLLLNRKGEVDFNKIARMPKDLNITAGGCDYGESKFFPDDIAKKSIRTAIDVILVSCYNKNLTQDEFVKAVLKVKTAKQLICDLLGTSKKDKEHIECYIRGFYNLKKHRAINWYDWHVKHWGTKWNGGDCSLEDDCITFDTAWSSPLPIFFKLSKKVPLTVAFSDEDIFGENAGVLHFENGEITDLSENTNLVALGMVLHGASREDYIDDEDECEGLPTDEDMLEAEKLLAQNNL